MIKECRQNRLCAVKLSTTDSACDSKTADVGSGLAEPATKALRCNAFLAHVILRPSAARTKRNTRKRVSMASARPQRARAAPVISGGSQNHNRPSKAARLPVARQWLRRTATHPALLCPGGAPRSSAWSAREPGSGAAGPVRPRHQVTQSP